MFNFLAKFFIFLSYKLITKNNENYPKYLIIFFYFDDTLLQILANLMFHLDLSHKKPT